MRDEENNKTFNDRPLVVLLPMVKAEIGAIGKGDRNQQQGFNFRGIDAVINAVSPAFIKFGITVMPNVIRYEYGSVEVGKNRTPMGHVQVVVEYNFYGPLGDVITCSAPGEAMDSGDKATAKAMSVAYRTALLQALSLPTTEPDPDSVTYERTDPEALQRAINRVQQAYMATHDGTLDMADLAGDYHQRYGGDVTTAGVDDLDRYAEALGAPNQQQRTQEALARATQGAAAAAPTQSDDAAEPRE